jgi:hypothetical protein
VEASNTPTIRRLTSLRRHQLSPIAPLGDVSALDGWASRLTAITKPASLYSEFSQYQRLSRKF